VVIDADTDQIVCFCESCRAEARSTKENPEEFQFAHEDSCPHSDEKRTHRIFDAMATALEGETDHQVAFSAVTFLAVSMCAIAAEEVGVPLEIMANRFVRLFEHRLDDVGPFMQFMSNRDNVA
jgi:hypothetical protein